VIAPSRSALNEGSWLPVEHFMNIALPVRGPMIQGMLLAIIHYLHYVGFP